MPPQIADLIGKGGHMRTVPIPTWVKTTADGSLMADTLTPLLLDLLEGIAARPRPYAEVMDAWRTSCPRLPV